MERLSNILPKVPLAWARAYVNGAIGLTGKKRTHTHGGLLKDCSIMLHYRLKVAIRHISIFVL